MKSNDCFKHVINLKCPNNLCCTKIEKLGVKLGRHTILENVNLHIHCGDLTALIGPNGAGKSTLLKAMIGEIPHTGELRFLDSKGNRREPPLIGYVPQKLDFDLSSPTTVLDLFAAALGSRPVWLSRLRKIRNEVKSALALVEAEQLIDRRLGALSGGELQRVLLALALNPIPNLLLLDEPVSGIDRKGLAMFYEMVSTLRRNYDLSIILISHDLDLVAQYADRVLFLNNKTIEYSGSPREVFGFQGVIETFGLRQRE